MEIPVYIHINMRNVSRGIHIHRTLTIMKILFEYRDVRLLEYFCIIYLSIIPPIGVSFILFS